MKHFEKNDKLKRFTATYYFTGSPEYSLHFVPVEVVENIKNNVYRGPIKNRIICEHFCNNVKLKRKDVLIKDFLFITKVTEIIGNRGFIRRSCYI